MFAAGHRTGHGDTVKDISLMTLKTTTGDNMIALYYAMPKEIDSLLKDNAAALMQTIAGVSFYKITDDIIAVAGGIGKVNAAMAAQL